ncbi:MAG: tryptophan 7-halogenase [Anaerolineales bacterium]|nr:tryptophan 7-halogenase [Anaerolineales bacterium]
MNIPTSCDVVVVGGGPAGSLLSTYLSQKGYDIVLFDKQKHPRYAVGESLIPDFWKFTDLAGVSDKIEAEGFIDKAGGVAFWQGEIRGHTFKDFGYSRPAMHIERARFDHILIENSREKGTKVFEEVAVLKADFEKEDEVVVTYRPVNEGEPGTISCRFVVDASGQNAVIGKQLGLREMDPAFRYMGVWGYFDGSDYVDFDGNTHSRDELGTVKPVTFISSLDENGDAGWSWHIALRDNTSVGIVKPVREMKQDKGRETSWESWFEETARTIPVTGDLLKSATLVPGSVRVIRDYSYQSKRLAGPGYFLIGDAAGFVDPIFSVGVVLSMYSAYAASWAIDASFKKPESTELNQELFSRQLQGRLEIARSLALPRYRSEDDGVSELAKQAIQLERNDVRELMHAVSSLTTRSDNFKEMVNHKDVPQIDTDKVKIIEKVN